MRKIVFFVLLLLGGQAFGSVPRYERCPFKDPVITDEGLYGLAVEKGIVPNDVDTQAEMAKKNTVVLWVVQSRQTKMALVDMLKMKFSRDGIRISNPTEYYVDEINSVLYNSFLREDVFFDEKKGIGVIFKTIAIMDGDYDNGENSEELLRTWMGEQNLELMKRYFPGKMEEYENHP